MPGGMSTCQDSGCHAVLQALPKKKTCTIIGRQRSEQESSLGARSPEASEEKELLGSIAPGG